ncbi:MAG: helix-turn-helix transcriptional regulator [Candidatus Cybelea sp.]
MPRVPGLLTEAERRSFGEYLRMTRLDRGRSKRDVAVALAGRNVDKADVNRTRVSDYESGKVPTAATIRKLAAIYRISTVSLLRMAGHAAELLRPIVMLLEAGRAQENRLFSQVGVLFALFAFPRRGDTLHLGSVMTENELDKAFSEASRLRQPRGRLPHLIGLARAALRDSELPRIVRRNIAAEYVHVYVWTIEPELYETALRNLYSQEKTV